MTLESLVIYLLDVPADMTHTKDTLAYRIQISDVTNRERCCNFLQNQRRRLFHNRFLHFTLTSSPFYNHTTKILLTKIKTKN